MIPENFQWTLRKVAVTTLSHANWKTGAMLGAREVGPGTKRDPRLTPI
jgi:hypothetical protein